MVRRIQGGWEPTGCTAPQAGAWGLVHWEMNRKHFIWHVLRHGTLPEAGPLRRMGRSLFPPGGAAALQGDRQARCILNLWKRDTIAPYLLDQRKRDKLHHKKVEGQAECWPGGGVRTVHRRPQSPQVLALPTTSRVALSRTPTPLMLPQGLPRGLQVLEMMAFRTYRVENPCLSVIFRQNRTSRFAS